MDNPSKIREGGVIYSLGEFDGKQVEYDFSKVLTYLDAKGKMLFGRNFRLFPEDHKVLLKLCNYMVRDRTGCQKMGIDPAVLSRSVEEGVTLMAGLIPWTTAGAFYAATLGIPVLEFAPYALLNLLNPLVAIVFAYLGIAVFKTKPIDRQNSSA